MYQALLDIFRELPSPYATDGLPFWDDDHISKSMLCLLYTSRCV